MSDSGSGEEADEPTEKSESDERNEEPDTDERNEEPDTDERNEEPDTDERNEEPDADEPESASREPGEEIPETERAPLSDLRARVEAEEDRLGAADVDVEGEAPLSELARESQATRDEEDSGLFDEVDVGDIDADAIWDAVVEEGEPPGELLGDAAEAEPTAEPTAGVDEHVINKREYCQRCEYFSEPPDVACGNEGTEILEMPDKDCFRVRDCPKVQESDEELSSVVEE